MNPFRNREQQLEAYEAGMWIFLASELMLFGGLFLCYLLARMTHHPEFVASSHHLDRLLGSLNTALLLTSSYTVAMGVDHAREGRFKKASWLLGATTLMGLAFLGIKMHEWHTELSHGRGPDENVFFWLYFVMTGLHAFHMVMGVLAMSILIYLLRRRPDVLDDPSPVIMGGLYWHLVDIIWIFLFPCLYLIGGPG